MSRELPAPLELPTLFVVQHRNDGIAERVFVYRTAAVDYCRGLNRACRAWANPFEWSGDPKKLCSAGVRNLRRSLKALGVPAPKRGQNWSDWWEVTRPTMTAEQCNAVWDLLDNFHAFVVVEVPLED